MKKLFSMILLAVVLFAACTHENDPVVKQIVTIQASIAHDSDSRVALGGTDETKVNWTQGDVINLTIGNNGPYQFTWQGGTTFAYEGTLPTLEENMVITATYVSTFSTTQTGFKADVGNYMALSATTTVQGQDYNDLELRFSHGTSVLKLTLSNANFIGQEVKNIILKAGGTVVAEATGTFQGDAYGNVTAYLAIQPATLKNITLHATCNGNTYTNSLANKTVEAGKIYLAEKNLPYAYVDLGLPSGTKWASFNVGATSPEGYGHYFAWGEIETKPGGYNFGDYMHNNSYTNLMSLKKYCNNAAYGYEGFTDNRTTLEPEDDAATANWGSYWRTPTSAEMQELLDKCTEEWTTMNGVKGLKVTSNINSNSIFLPAAGYKNYYGNTTDNEVEGSYWSSSLFTELCINAIKLCFDIEEPWLDQGSRNLGFPVRPVYKGN